MTHLSLMVLVEANTPICLIAQLLGARQYGVGVNEYECLCARKCNYFSVCDHQHMYMSLLHVLAMRTARYTLSVLGWHR